MILLFGLIPLALSPTPEFDRSIMCRMWAQTAHRGNENLQDMGVDVSRRTEV